MNLLRYALTALLIAVTSAAGLDTFGASVGGPVTPSGTPINCPLPFNLQQKNTGGSDGSGLCVYASNRHQGRWQNDPAFDGLFDWMKRYPGGSYPQKFQKTLEKFCQEKGYVVPPYIQVESNDLEILRLASKTGRMPGVTYSFSPTGRYGGQRIAHMVSLVHADANTFTILDNNYVGSDSIYEHQSPQEFLKVYSGGSTGWAVILLNPGPPPVMKEK